MTILILLRLLPPSFSCYMLLVCLLLFCFVLFCFVLFCFVSLIFIFAVADLEQSRNSLSERCIQLESILAQVQLPLHPQPAITSLTSITSHHSQLL